MKSMDCLSKVYRKPKVLVLILFGLIFIEQVVGVEEGIATEKQLKKVTFRFHPVTSGVQSVFLAGTFNDWNGSKTQMRDNDGDGVYEATLFLPTGCYQYKFVVDHKWITDTSAHEFADDGQGSKNSIVIVDDSYPDVKFMKGDSSIFFSDISLNLDYSMVNSLDTGKIEFRTRAHRNDVEDIYLLYAVNGGKERAVRLIPGEADAVFRYYSVVLNVLKSSKISFTFLYSDGDKNYYATPGGFMHQKPDVDSMFKYSEKILEPFHTPGWAKKGVFYQIFPDRFRNGGPSNDQDFHEEYYKGKTTLPPSGKTNGEYFHFVHQWNDVNGLLKSPYRTDGKPDYYSFYGGDIAGVMEKLPYLSNLGITIIYFNPLCEGKSNHKYDCVDYLKIDPHFATEKKFKEFVKKAHTRGIRIIVDMAFNHTGDWHFAFVDTKKKGRKSKYWNWYEWKRWPLPKGGAPTPCNYYACWWGFPLLPNLNYDLSRPNDQENMIEDISKAKPNMEVVNYILNVGRYWLGTLGIDGFRLDVPNEVPLWFWKEFRKVVDEVKPDAFLIGEIWGNAMPWLGPHCFHATMNYKFFRDPVVKFFALGQECAAQFDEELTPGRNIYPIQATQVMMNLIGSHDTERFVTLADNNDKRLMLAALFQMTYVGIPEIYYGDEVGLRGGKDPDNRRTFPWDWRGSPRRKSIHDFYRKIISIRHKYNALSMGKFCTVLTEGKVYSYLREDKNNRIVVVLNNEPETERVKLPLKKFGFKNGTNFKDELGGDKYTVNKGKLKLEIKPLSGAILVMKPAK